MKVFPVRTSMVDGDLVGFELEHLHDATSEWMHTGLARELAARILQVCDDIEAVDAAEDERRKGQGDADG